MTIHKLDKHIAHGIVHIHLSNKTSITITDNQNTMIAGIRCPSAWSKSNNVQEGASSSIKDAVQQLSEKVIKKFGMHSVDVKVKGQGFDLCSVLQALSNTGLSINSIQDMRLSQVPTLHRLFTPKRVIESNNDITPLNSNTI